MFGVGEVGGEVGFPEGAVPGLEDVGVVDLTGGAAVLGAGPPGMPVVQDGDVVDGVTSRHLCRDRGEFGSEPLDLLIGAALLPAWLTIPEWNFSAPCRDWRHWK